MIFVAGVRVLNPISATQALLTTALTHGGALLAAKVGLIINTSGYVPLFAIAASAYLLAFLFMQLLSPKLETVKLAD